MVENFRLPIETLEKSKKLEENIVADLELSEKDGERSLYSYLFRYSNHLGKNMVEKWNKVWTDDICYLKDTKLMIKNYSETKSIDCEKWTLLKSNKNFIEKYYYIDWKYFIFLNDYSCVHQFLSVYRLISPICTVILPLVIMFAGWFILRLMGVNMSFSMFYQQLKILIKNKTSIGKIISGFNNSSSSSKCYAVFSLIMYIIQIYNNIMVLINFNKNLGEMHNYICDIKKYLITTVENMKHYSYLISKYDSYSIFNKELTENSNKIEDIINEIKNIPKTHKSMIGFYYVGYVQKIIYKFYNDKDFERVMNYSLGFNGYIDNLNGIKENIRMKCISYAQFNIKKHTHFKDAYYPPLLSNNEKDSIVKNSYKLDKELLISGPNASGKTTVLKTTLFNIICSQQLGVGFYKNANIQIYSNLYCYLNIPDTSGRDSLFQAEARRCIDILNSISSKSDENSFCIFDELYSGTNHYEAISSAFSFLNYLVENHNFHFMMTTHFIDLCKKLPKKNENVGNLKMCVKEKNDDFIYTYKMRKGISEIKGGVKVLKDLNYPDEIISNTKIFIDTEF